jgi:hypothetical protein
MLINTKNFKVTARSLLFDPQFYVFDVAPELDETSFLVVEEENLSLAPFVDIRFEPLAHARFSVSTKELMNLEMMHNTKRSQPAFIFHHAFVCSTLLARCLDQIDAFFSLKEPWVLRRLADLKRVQAHKFSRNQWRRMFTTYTNLLAKNYRTGRSPVIKVTNVANNLLEDVLRYLPDQKILYLYSDLESFLVSNLKKPQDTQVKMPGLASAFLADGDFAQKFPQFSDVKQLSFLQTCALIWLVNLYNFQRSTEKFNQANVKTLQMKNFLTDMGGSLKSLSSFYGYNATASEIEKMLDPSVTQTDAKHQQNRYGKQLKQVEAEEIKNRYSIEINKAISWINPLVEALGVLDYSRAHELE